MTISRRMALGAATAFAATASTARVSFASVMKRASGLHLLRYDEDGPAAQRFMELLVHEDENGGQSFSSMIWVTAPDSPWFAASSLDETEYGVINTTYKSRHYRLRRVSAYNTSGGVRYAGVWEKVKGPEWHSRHGMTQGQFAKSVVELAGQGFCMTHADARVGYAGIWEKGDSSSQKIVHGLSSKDYQQQAAAFAAQGLQPIRISGASTDHGSHYTAIFEPSTVTAWYANNEMTPDAFAAKDADLTAQGYRMTDASGHMQKGKPLLSGVWELA